MAKPKISLKLGLMMTIVICWLVPIIIIVTLAGVLFGDNYRRSVQQEIAASAEYALRQVRLQLEDVVNDSKTMSYDGIVRSAYRSYQQSGDSAALYRSINDYLSQNYSRGIITRRCSSASGIRMWTWMPTSSAAAPQGMIFCRPAGTVRQ